MNATITTTALGVTASMALLMAWGTPAVNAEPQVESVWASMPKEMKYYIAGSTVSGILSAPESRSTQGMAEIVVELKNESGLTADQLGRALGVSRRSIHNWANGAAISTAREERIRKLSDLVFSLGADSPEERRRILLNSFNGPSLYKKFLDSGKRNEKIKYSVPVRERFGA